jgi:hypothetical protein
MNRPFTAVVAAIGSEQAAMKRVVTVAEKTIRAIATPSRVTG